MIISSYAEALRILRDSQYSSSRTESLLRPWEENLGGASLQALRSFHSAWLMYMEGPEHRRLREMVLDCIDAMSSLTAEWLAMDVALALNQGRIDDNVIDAMTARWHQRFLGIDAKQHTELFRLSRPLLDFFFRDVVDPERGVLGLEAGVEELQNWYFAQAFEANGILHLLGQTNMPLGTRINVAIDSFEPVRNAISSVFLLIASRGGCPPNVENDDLTAETFRLFPPFRFINRC